MKIQLKLELRVFFIACLLFLFVILTGCGRGEDGKVGETSSQDSQAPEFEGFVLVVSSNTDSVSMAWMPAIDNITPQDNIVYEIYYDTNANFIPDMATLDQVLIGETSGVVVGLTEGTEYFFKIIAIDESGNRTEATDYARVVTADQDVIYTKTQVNNVEDLRLYDLKISDDNKDVYIFEISPLTIVPAVGSALVGEDVDGKGYLRIVDGVTLGASSISLETRAGELTDVFETASISSEVVLRDTGYRDMIPSTRNIKSGNTEDPYKLVWKDKLLYVSESRSHSPFLVTRSKQKESEELSSVINVSASQALTLTGTITFEPTVRVDVLINRLAIERAMIEASGTLSMDVSLEYNYDGVVEINESKEVFSRSYISRYKVGSVYVYQETILVLNAEFIGSSTSALRAESRASVSSDVAVRASYDGEQWSYSTNRSFDKELTVSASAHGSAATEVRLVPEIRVRFYEAVSATISAEPYVKAIVEVEAVASQDLIDSGFGEGYGFTKFDAFIGADINLVADLSVFSSMVARYPETGKLNIYNKTWQLFGLPDIEATAELTSENSYVFRVIEAPFESEFGLKNSIDVDSPRWIIFPSAEMYSGMIISWAGECSQSDVYFIGYSELLGPMGRQYAKVRNCGDQDAITISISRDDGLWEKVAQNLWVWNMSMVDIKPLGTVITNWGLPVHEGGYGRPMVIAATEGKKIVSVSFDVAQSFYGSKVYFVNGYRGNLPERPADPNLTGVTSGKRFYTPELVWADFLDGKMTHFEFYDDEGFDFVTIGESSRWGAFYKDITVTLTD